jgi:demethylmenaquinone methyltransferase/2-methoxy-6-polyprenyl-1,4-benzoquinol methylase
MSVVAGSASILAEQIAFYRAVAREYEYHDIDPASLDLDLTGFDELFAAIDAFRPTGDVLELACGTGVWTQHLTRFATNVTAVDAAPEMLQRAKKRGGAESVQFIEADLFSWQPDDRYDTVFFGFWISHVPEERFDSFWSLVDDCLRPDGQVFFFDDNYRTEAELIEGSTSPIIQRKTRDGTPFHIVKRPFRAEELEGRLRALGWDITVTSTSGPFYWGTGHR